MSSNNKKSVWVTFSLYEFVELSKNYAQVEQEIKNAMGDNINCFLPINIQKIAAKEVVTNLFEGYAFVEHDGTPDFEDRAKDVRGSYVESLLYDGKRPCYILDKEIQRYRDQMKNMLYTYTPQPDDQVIGIEGTFKNMVGRVLEVNLEKKQADVAFRTRTREVKASGLSFLGLHLYDPEEK